MFLGVFDFEYFSQIGNHIYFLNKHVKNAILIRGLNREFDFLEIL